MAQTAPAPGSINLFDLPIPQLQAVGQQLEEVEQNRTCTDLLQEIQILTQSFGKLKQAQVKFVDGLDSLKRLQAGGEGKEVLVPLTNSLYVGGQLEDAEKVVVDVGTGYYFEKVTLLMLIIIGNGHDLICQVFKQI